MRSISSNQRSDRSRTNDGVGGFEMYGSPRFVADVNGRHRVKLGSDNASEETIFPLQSHMNPEGITRYVQTPLSVADRHPKKPKDMV